MLNVAFNLNFIKIRYFKPNILHPGRVNTIYPHQLLLQPDNRPQFETMLSDLGITSPGGGLLGDLTLLGDRMMCKVVEIADGMATVNCGRHQFIVPAGKLTFNYLSCKLISAS